jgi:hypothetical protein
MLTFTALSEWYRRQSRLPTARKLKSRSAPIAPEPDWPDPDVSDGALRLDVIEQPLTDTEVIGVVTDHRYFGAPRTMVAVI